MHFRSIFLHSNRSNPLRHHHHSLTFLRWMGGGPRTFPGGLNKWQWKRMHEKKAREKEKRLLDHEKQLYQARIRSQIRAQLESSENPNFKPDNQFQPNYSPLSPQEHIKALADRFMKEGAEDLWNEKDGPVEIPESKAGGRRISGEMIDLERFIGERSNFDGGIGRSVSGDVSKGRFYSTSSMFSSGESMNGYSRRVCDGFGLGCGYRSRFFMNVSSGLRFRSHYSSSAGVGVSNRVDSSRNGMRLVNDGDSGRLSGGGVISRRVDGSRNGLKLVRDGDSGSGRRKKWPRFRGGELGSSDDDDESDDYSDMEEDGLEDGGRKIVGSSAALGKYDRKTNKRVPLKFLEEEVDLSQQVEAIRREVEERRSMREDGREASEEESILSAKRFDECEVSPLTVQALTESGLVQMTRVQDATLAACLEGKDVLVKARAGTGKSIAFLLPAIETVLKASNRRSSQRVPPIYVLVLCPTRELASQIAAEANVLLKHHNGIGVQTLVGGTRFKVDQRRLETDPCQIVVATPGRLLDHVEDKSGISVRLMGLQILILDEADHLLDLGFRKDIEKIVDCLPRKRQSLLFSATIPKEVRRVSQLVLKREHVYIDTVGVGSMEIHPKVKQSYLVAPHDQHLQILYHVLKGHVSQVPEYKVVVFCATAMMTSLVYSLFREMKLNVREIHSKNPPLYRTRISNEFKESKGLILITSDVSTRGMNYPDVTLVIQVGIPTDRGQYIHRLGRTGRQGKEGEGFLLLAPWEKYFLDEIKDLPLEECPPLSLDPVTKVKIEDKMGKIDTSIKEAAYHSWLGYYNSINAIGRDKTSLVEFANQFSASIGLEKPPALFRKTAIKMGLKDIIGIRIRK